MAKSRKYHTLAVRDAEDHVWSPQFGDYDRSVVAQELVDTKDQWPRGTRFQIITTGDKQRDLDEAIAALNHGQRFVDASAELRDGLRARRQAELVEG